MNFKEETPVEKFNRENRERREREKKEEQRKDSKDERVFFETGGTYRVEAHGVDLAKAVDESVTCLPLRNIKVEITDAKNGEFMLVDDPEQETTEEDRKNVMKWFERCVDKTNEGKNFFLDLVKKYKKEVLALLGVPPHVTGPGPAAYRGYVDQDYVAEIKVGDHVVVDFKEIKVYPEEMADRIEAKNGSYGTVQAIHVEYGRNKNIRTSQVMADVLLDNDRETLGTWTSTMTPKESAEDITLDTVEAAMDEFGGSYMSKDEADAAISGDIDAIKANTDAVPIVNCSCEVTGFNNVKQFGGIPQDINNEVFGTVEDYDEETGVATVDITNYFNKLFSTGVWDEEDADPVNDVRTALGLPELVEDLDREKFENTVQEDDGNE